MIISLSVNLHYVHYFHPNLKMLSRYKVMYGCECCRSAKSIQSSLLSWRDCYLRKRKDTSQNDQNRSSGKKASHICKTYKRIVIPHGHHIYAKAYDLAKAIICSYSQSDHVLLHSNCILRCWTQCPIINIPDQERNDKHPNPSPSISFQIYHLISRCTKNGRLLLTDNKICRECQQNTASGQLTKIYTRKELLMTETTISNFCTSFFIH